MEANELVISDDDEITDKMIEAGVSALAECDVHEENWEYIVWSIYLAMQTAKK